MSLRCYCIKTQSNKTFRPLKCFQEEPKWDISAAGCLSDALQAEDVQRIHNRENLWLDSDENS